MPTWEKNIVTIRKTAGKHPQESYSTVERAIQSELIFLQHVTWYTGDVFTGVEKILQETFLSRLFFGKYKSLPPIVGNLSTMQVKRYGLGLQDPVTSSN